MAPTGKSVVKKLILPPALGSYVTVFKPRAFEEGPAKYSIVLLWDKADKEKLKALSASVVEIATQAFGPTALDLLKAGKLKNPLRDGDTEKDDALYKGKYFLTASANEDKQPAVVDKHLQPIFEESECYSGCTFRASVALFSFDKKGNKGVAVGLNNLMVVSKGPRLDGRKSAEDDFKEYAETPAAGSAPAGAPGAADDLL
jgi:hypothetical protein